MTAGVSIRAPREGGDVTVCAGYGGVKSFQSAPPVKGATDGAELFAYLCKFQSAPPVKGATSSEGIFSNIFRVSIRAPREGGDRDSVRSSPR